MLSVCANTSNVTKGGQAPQVADFTGLKCNPCNYSILFFLPRFHLLCFYMSSGSPPGSMWRFAVVRSWRYLSRDSYGDFLTRIFSPSNFFIVYIVRCLWGNKHIYLLCLRLYFPKINIILIKWHYVKRYKSNRIAIFKQHCDYSFTKIIVIFPKLQNWSLYFCIYHMRSFHRIKI